MNTLDKLRFFESDAVPKNGVKVECLSTSLKFTLACGCVLVEHYASGPIERKPSETVESYHIRHAHQKYHVELCSEHHRQLDALKKP